MELYQEILMKLLVREKVEITFPNLKLDASELVAQESYRALQQIKAIIENDELSDEACFHKIEEIIRIFEAMGSDGGNRHDFG